jgi:CRP-like cAMP-binding protein
VTDDWTLLAGLSADERRHVLAAGIAKALAKGEVLFRQGEPAESLFVVEDGRVKMTQLGAEGQEVILRLAGPGEMFAAIAVLDGKTYPFGASAVAETRVRHWPRKVLHALFRSLPTLQSNVLGVVGSHSREMLDRFRELATEPAPRRLARALLRLLPDDPAPQKVEGLTRQDLADMTGTTLYTVSRILSEWQSDGIVETGRGRVAVRARARLEALADPA